jgi:intracellular sulfur oxidation DsrE/DsrF family protein
MSNSATPRRGFLGRAAAALLGVAAAPSLTRALSGANPAADESWLRGLNGKHKQFFDMATVRDGRPLSRVANFLDVYGAEVYGLKDADLSAVVGMHGGALALALNDSLWSKYKLGKRNAANDPLTKTSALRNPFVKRDAAYEWSNDYSISRLQERGVRFIACMRSMRGLAVELAPNREAAPQIVAEMLANLIPGVTPVPAMIVAINRAQEEGLSYVYTG